MRSDSAHLKHPHGRCGPKKEPERPVAVLHAVDARLHEGLVAAHPRMHPMHDGFCLLKADPSPAGAKLLHGNSRLPAQGIEFVGTVGLLHKSAERANDAKVEVTPNIVGNAVMVTVYRLDHTLWSEFGVAHETSDRGIPEVILNLKRGLFQNE